VIDEPPPEGTDSPHVEAALRVGFTGKYDEDEDDFAGTTYFLSPTSDDGEFDPFKTSDKRKCGFLFLRTLRTGSRALSLERGSLLDIILRLKNGAVGERALWVSRSGFKVPADQMHQRSVASGKGQAVYLNISEMLVL